MKYSRSALGLLNAQYKSVLKKCLLINLGLFALGMGNTQAEIWNYQGEGSYDVGLESNDYEKSINQTFVKNRMMEKVEEYWLILLVI